MSNKVREFPSGATRDNEAGKLNYEGFFSPIVLERYAEYLHKHRRQTDGTLRDADNWQKGMPVEVFMESLLRHVIDVWKLHRGYVAVDRKTGEHVDIEDALCAAMFNVQGYLFMLLGGAGDPEEAA